MSPLLYTLLYTTAAGRQIEKLPHMMQQRVLAALERLEVDPRPVGVKGIKGSSGGLRLRVGDYRVLYEVDDAARQVLVVRVGHRRDVYDR